MPGHTVTIPLEMQYYILDAYLEILTDSTLSAPVVRHTRWRSKYISITSPSAILTLLLTCKTYCHYIGHHRLFDRLRLYHLLNNTSHFDMQSIAIASSSPGRWSYVQMTIRPGQFSSPMVLLLRDDSFMALSIAQDSQTFGTRHNIVSVLSPASADLYVPLFAFPGFLDSLLTYAEARRMCVVLHKRSARRVWFDEHREALQKPGPRGFVREIDTIEYPSLVWRPPRIRSSSDDKQPERVDNKH